MSPIKDLWIGDPNSDAHIDIMMVSNEKNVSNAIGPYDASTGGILLGTSEVGIFQNFEFFQSHHHLSYDRILPMDVDSQRGQLSHYSIENRAVIDF